MPVPPARARATKPTRQSSGVDAAVLGQAAADAAEHLVGAAAAQLRAGRRTGRRGRRLPGRRVQRRAGSAGGGAGGGADVMAQKPADRAARNPSGKAPIRPWFLYRGDHRCRPGCARCDDRYRDHHRDRGAASRDRPRGRRSCAPGRAGCWPASRPGRRRTCGRTRSSSGSPSSSWRRHRDRRRRLRAAVADHAGRGAGRGAGARPVQLGAGTGRRQLLGLAVLGVAASALRRPGPRRAAARWCCR